MTFSKLLRQIRREALRNPKKAAILGVLFLVALYFWAPLVWEWIPKGEASADSAFSEISTDVGAPIPGAISGPSGETDARNGQTAVPKFAWTQLDQWMKQDPRTTPAEDFFEQRDPFAVRVHTDDERSEEETESIEALLTPERLGLRLSSTVIGTGRRVALIGGQVYRPNDVVKTRRDDSTIEFEVVEVLPRRVVLRRNGQQYELSIPERASGGWVEPSERRD